jgi:LPPG:FO 2-phospho-L-lactate transferase
MIVALAGGVGGAKLALGLTLSEPPENLIVVVNTGDDFRHLGLYISPDVDTVIYTLAGLANIEMGWGLAAETWSFMRMLERVGGETWFKLGDQDLAVHVERSRLLAQGLPLSSITNGFCQRLNVRHRVLPMTDDEVRTVIHVNGATIPFQDYFVRQKCTPIVEGISYVGAPEAQPLAQVMTALSSEDLEGIIICPSNPFLSIGPMLAMSKLRLALLSRRSPAIAVSPIIGGKAVKGPAAKIMSELGIQPTCVAVAQFYQGLIDCLVIDRADAQSSEAIRELGIEPLVVSTVMRSIDDRQRLAVECCAWIRK